MMKKENELKPQVEIFLSTSFFSINYFIIFTSLLNLTCSFPSLLHLRCVSDQVFKALHMEDADLVSQPDTEDDVKLGKLFQTAEDNVDSRRTRRKTQKIVFMIMFPERIGTWLKFRNIT